MIFYLGTNRPNWLGTVNVPLFMSRRVLEDRRKLTPALDHWALDSGAFSELMMFGEYRMTEAKYIATVRRLATEVGSLDWAAPMDWMCEPEMLAKTGLTVEEHQRRTVDNFLRLRESELPFIPVLQGWSYDDYLRHVEMYDYVGVDLAGRDRVGLGSVCRRQAMAEASALVYTLSVDYGFKLHGFGVKLAGVRRFGAYLASADSLAWTVDARSSPPLPHHVGRHKHCQGCPEWALGWRDKVNALIAQHN